MIDIYSKIAPRYDRMHRKWLKYAGGEAQAAFEASITAHIRPGMSVLDAGCGTGEFARHLTALYGGTIGLTLYDACPEMLAQTHGIPAERAEGCLCDMPFADDSFDLISAAWSIETTPDPAKALAELMRVLKPGGQLVIVFCATTPTDRLLARVLRQSVTLRGTGRFLDVDDIHQHLTANGAEAVTRLRCDGPAAVFSAQKPAAMHMALAA